MLGAIRPCGRRSVIGLPGGGWRSLAFCERRPALRGMSCPCRSRSLRAYCASWVSASGLRSSLTQRRSPIASSVTSWRRCSGYCRRRSPSGASVRPMRVATWNVNSAKQRLPRLLPWLEERQPDVVCLQETKLADDAFKKLLGDALAERDYAVAVHGEPTWNGVAVLSRVGLDDVVKGLPGEPGFPDPEARAV